MQSPYVKSLCKHYPRRDEIVSHVSAAVESYSGLRAELDNFTYDDGRVELLVNVTGIVPVTLRANTYNCPIALWLPLEYPSKAPIGFILPSSTMMIKASKSVDPGGKVTVPYLDAWGRKPEGCSLVPLIEVLQATFGIDYPLVSIKTKPRPAPVPPTSSNHRPPPIPPQPLLPPQNMQIPNKDPSKSYPYTPLQEVAGGLPHYQYSSPNIPREDVLAQRSVASRSYSQPNHQTVPSVPQFQNSIFEHGGHHLHAHPESAYYNGSEGRPSTHPFGSPPIPPSTSKSFSSPPIEPSVRTPLDRSNASRYQAPSSIHPAARSFSGPVLPSPYRNSSVPIASELPKTEEQRGQQNSSSQSFSASTSGLVNHENFTHRSDSQPSQSRPYSAAFAGNSYDRPAQYTSPKMIYQDRSNPPPNILDENDDAVPGSSGQKQVGQVGFNQNSSTQPPPPVPPNPELLALRAQLHAKLSRSLETLSGQTESSLTHMERLEHDLRKGEPAIVDEMQRLQAVRAVCETVRDRYKVLVQEGENRLQEYGLRGEGPEVDEIVCSSTVVYNQLLDLVAEDSALEDTIYHLGRALNSETANIDLDRFLKRVRGLAREQFLKRALINKILSTLPAPRTRNTVSSPTLVQH